MTTATLGPSAQLAVRGRWLVPMPAPAGSILVGGGLLGKSQFGVPAGYERAVLPAESRGLLPPRVGGGSVPEPERVGRGGEFLRREPNRSSASLGEEHTVSPDGPFERPPQERDILPFLAAVRGFIEAGHLAAARKLVSLAPAYILIDPLVARLRKVLAPPVVTPVARRDVDRTLEYEWLRTEGYKYRGRWVALEGNNLLATGATLRVVRESLKALTPARPPLLHRLD